MSVFMKLLQIALAAVFLSFFTGCSSQAPGEYSYIKSNTYNHVDVPLDLAWQKSIEILNSRWEIVSNDTVEKVLVVKTFYHDVEVEFKPLTANTCEFKVSSAEYWVKPNKAAVHSVFMELDRALKSLED